MEQNDDKNKFLAFVKENRSYVLAGLVAVIAVVLLFTTRQNGTVGENRNEQTSSETDDRMEDSGDKKEEEKMSESPKAENTDKMAETKPAAQNQAVAGSFSVAGVLRASNNSNKGNLMLESDQGTIYIKTKRDFSKQIDSKVSLHAEGTINSFAFIGFDGVSGDKVATPEQAKGTFTVSGELRKSDNLSRGNFAIHTASGHIYLKTAHDYSNWVGGQVNLTASGSINSFSNAIITKK